jgi:hypothetical protein
MRKPTPLQLGSIYVFNKNPVHLDQATDVQLCVLELSGLELTGRYGYSSSGHRLCLWLKERYDLSQRTEDLTTLRALHSALISSRWAEPFHSFQSVLLFLRLPGPLQCPWDPRPYDIAINRLMLIATYGVSNVMFEGTLRLADIGPFLGDAVATALEANYLAQAFGWPENGRHLTWKAISARWQPPGAIDETHPDFAQTISSRAPEIMHSDQDNDYSKSDTRIDTAAALATFDGVFLNPGKIRCDAIILGCSPGELQHVRLGNVYHRVIGWQQELAEGAAVTSGDSRASASATTRSSGF